MTSKISNKNKLIDILFAFIIVYISFNSIYYLPDYISRILFVCYLILFYFSKSEYFWFAFYFFLIEQPGGLFLSGILGSKGLPYYTVLPGVTLNAFDLFLVVALIKTIVNKRKSNVIFKKYYTKFIFYFLLLLFISFFIGIDYRKISSILILITIYSLFVTFPAFNDNETKFVMFFNLLYFYMIIVFMMQIFEMINGYEYGALFLAHKREIIGVEYSRLIYSPYLNLSCFISSQFYLFEKKNKPFNKLFLMIILFICIMSIFISATRGWIIAYFLIILFNSLFNLKTKKVISMFAVFGLLFLLLLSFSERFKYYIKMSWERTQTVEKVVEGDLTAQGTLQRVTERSPRVLKKYIESPIIGFGFSKEYYEFRDGHVGNQNMLLNSGIFGYLLFLSFWIFFFRINYKVNSLLNNANPFKNKLFIFSFALIGILFIHSTSTQIFGFELGSDYEKMLFLSIFFSFNSLCIKDALKYGYNKKEAAK